MASSDIKDACYSIPIDESSQKYLKSIWKEQFYQFCVLLNGLSPCPRRFTKLQKLPLAELMIFIFNMTPRKTASKIL